MVTVLLQDPQALFAQVRFALADKDGMTDDEILERTEWQIGRSRDCVCRAMVTLGVEPTFLPLVIYATTEDDDARELASEMLWEEVKRRRGVD